MRGGQRQRQEAERFVELIEVEFRRSVERRMDHDEAEPDQRENQSPPPANAAPRPAGSKRAAAHVRSKLRRLAGNDELDVARDEVGSPSSCRIRAGQFAFARGKSSRVRAPSDFAPHLDVDGERFGHAEQR